MYWTQTHYSVLNNTKVIYCNTHNITGKREGHHIVDVQTCEDVPTILLFIIILYCSSVLLTTHILSEHEIIVKFIKLNFRYIKWNPCVYFYKNTRKFKTIAPETLRYPMYITHLFYNLHDFINHCIMTW